MENYNLSKFYSYEARPQNYSDLCSNFYSEYYTVYIHTFLSFGDYDNSCAVERANVRWFLENYEGSSAWLIKGGYGSEAILFNEAALQEPFIIDLFDSLENYPVLCDNTLYHLEDEMKEDAWQSYGQRDFIDLLEKNNIEPSEYLYYQYLQLCENQNIYIEIEAGGSVYFPNPFK